MARCEVNDPDCEIQTRTECFRCGLAACKHCSSLVEYSAYGRKRIGNDCMIEAIRHDENWAANKMEVPAPPLDAELSEGMKDYWRDAGGVAYQKALSKRGV